MEEFPDALTVPVRFTGEQDDPMLAYLDRLAPDWVINCAGATGSEPDLWIINAILPHRIRWPLIQPSTDHLWDDTEYARSKRLGEAGRVIRCAIVDPDGGMLARCREQDTDGSTEREWNGVTARTWARLAREVIRGKLATPLLPGSPTISHHALQETARAVFGWTTRTRPVRGPRWTTYRPTLMLTPIADQLAEYL